MRPRLACRSTRSAASTRRTPTTTWAHFERGEYSAARFVEAFEGEASAIGFEVDGSRVIASLRGVIRPAMVEALRRCSANFKTAMLTNNFTPPTSESGTEAMVSDAGVDGDGAPLAEIHDLFDEIVESSVVGVRKPERRFYEIACERLDVEPSECVFLDDLGINLKPAKAMGMQTIKVVDPDIASRNLRRSSRSSALTLRGGSAAVVPGDSALDRNIDVGRPWPRFGWEVGLCDPALPQPSA